MLTTMTKQNSAILHKILVYEKHDSIQLKCIGTGWIIYRDDGKVSAPQLFYDDGTEIPSGEYFLVNTEENHLVVVPKQKQ